MQTIKSAALISVAEYLKNSNYRFITTTPLSHKIVLERGRKKGSDVLRDFFGWNHWVEEKDLPTSVLKPLKTAELLEYRGSLVKSCVRASTLNELIFFHSSFPTEEKDSIFLGPDSYRFINYIKDKLGAPKVICDLGAGTGVGGIFAEDYLRKGGHYLQDFYLTDINKSALWFSATNAYINHIDHCQTIGSDLYASIPAGVDLFLANPPFIVDSEKRKYRDGGGEWGSELSTKIISGFIDYCHRQDQKAKLLLYTGACVLNGEDVVKKSLDQQLQKHPYFKCNYLEIDVDIFGDELAKEAYQNVDRIAAVGVELSNL